MVGPFLFATTVWTRRQVTLDHSGLKESKEADPPVILDGIHPTDLSSPPQKSRGDVAEKKDMDAVKEKETGNVKVNWLKTLREQEAKEEEDARLRKEAKKKDMKAFQTTSIEQRMTDLEDARLKTEALDEKLTAGITADKKALIILKMVQKRRDWLKAFFERHGLAPPSDCDNQEKGSCPTGPLASCYETEVGECKRKWEPRIDIPLGTRCSELKKPDHSQWLGKDKLVGNEEANADKTYCATFGCLRDFGKDKVCKEPSKDDLKRLEEAGHYGGVSNSSLEQFKFENKEDANLNFGEDKGKYCEKNGGGWELCEAKCDESDIGKICKPGNCYEGAKCTAAGGITGVCNINKMCVEKEREE